MTALAKCIVITMLALIVSGFLEASRDLYPKRIEHIVARNQTFWEVCSLYAPLDKKYKTMSEFVYETRKLNNGKIIYLPGEKVKIVVWQDDREGNIKYDNK